MMLLLSGPRVRHHTEVYLVIAYQAHVPSRSSSRLLCGQFKRFSIQFVLKCYLHESCCSIKQLFYYACPTDAENRAVHFL